MERSFEWSLEMPQSDFEQLAVGELESPEVEARRLSDWDASILPKPNRTILSTRLYLDADLVTEIAKGCLSQEVFINRYPKLVEAHWVKINSDIQSFKKILVQLKTVFLGFTSLLFLFDIGNPAVVWTLLAGNVASFVFPKGFGKVVILLIKPFIKI